MYKSKDSDNLKFCFRHTLTKLFNSVLLTCFLNLTIQIYSEVELGTTKYCG